MDSDTVLTAIWSGSKLKVIWADGQLLRNYVLSIFNLFVLGEYHVLRLYLVDRYIYSAANLFSRTHRTNGHGYFFFKKNWASFRGNFGNTCGALYVVLIISLRARILELLCCLLCVLMQSTDRSMTDKKYRWNDDGLMENILWKL